MKFKSALLKRVYEFLIWRGERGATTYEINENCNVASARDYVRRLRDHGLNIETKEMPRSDSGARVVKYTLRSGKLSQPDLFASGDRSPGREGLQGGTATG